MLRKILIFLWLSFLFASEASAYRNKKTILLVENQMQPDSMGFNVVEDMGRYVYEWVKENKVMLWDSPEKKFHVGFNDLQAIETSTRTDFSSPKNLFIYEKWSSTAAKFSFEIKGFSFANMGADSSDVLYGYLEFDSTVSALLSKAYLHVNANGSYGTTLLQVLMNKSYVFDIVFFFDAPVYNYHEALKLQKKALKKNKKFLNHIEVPEAKLLEYTITEGPEKSSENSRKIMKSLEDFFNNNPQEFFNYGGDRFYSYLKKTPVLINEIHVQEVWHKAGDSIRCDPKQIVPYIFGQALNPIPFSQLETWKLRADNTALTTTIREKKFYYKLYKINGTIIEEDEQTYYSAALKKRPWNDILPKESDNLSPE